MMNRRTETSIVRARYGIECVGTLLRVLSDAGRVLSVSSSQRCAYDGQPAVLSRAANCCPVLSMHRTDGGAR